MKKLIFLSTILFLALNQFIVANCNNPDCSCDPCYCNNCNNWYVAASGSVAWHDHVRFSNPGINGTDSTHLKTGGGAAISIGYIFDICNNWDIRLEAEGVWRRNSLKNVTLPNGTFPLSGHVQDLAIMANLLLDAPLGCGFFLYLGGGIGASRNEVDNTSSNIKSDKTVFAWQILAGLSYDICSNLALTGGYRLFATEKRTVGGSRFTNIPLTHSIDLGLRFKF